MSSIGIANKLEFNISSRNKNEEILLNLSDEININHDHYIWVSSPGIQGGFCIYQYDNIQIYNDSWEEEFSRKQSQKLEATIRESLQRPCHWSVVRYAGTDVVYNLSNGLFASSLAELTNGIIFSDDNDWEYSRFPCLPLVLILFI